VKLVTPMLGLGKNIVRNKSLPLIPWTPARISTAVWLDADDASTITLNGSTVSQWRDKSGNARHVAQATAGSQPTRTISGLGGKNVLTFDGADWLFNAIPGGLMRNATGGTVAAVVNYTNATAMRSPVSVMNGTGSSARFSTILQTTGRLNQAISRLDTDTETTIFSPSTYMNNTVTQIGLVNFTTAVLTQYVSGNYGGVVSLPSSGNSSDTDSATLVIGGSSTDDGATLQNPMLGFIAEIIVVNAALSELQRQRLEGYLAWKWGLVASLPSNHPYKLLAPFA